MDGLTILSVVDEDLPRLAEISFHARQDNPLTRAKWPEEISMDPKTRKDNFTSRFIFDYSSSRSTYLKATLNSEIIGFIVWDDPQDPKVHRINDCISHEQYLRGADMTLLRSMGARHNEAESEVDSPHQYLSDINVAKEAQGKGVGSQLLDWGLRLAQRRRQPVFCLSSDEGFRLYSKRGFEVVRWVEFQTSSGDIIKERVLWKPCKPSQEEDGP
ncbi:acyl-CoA N-acyltransferase [Kockovaella imperatae]|uniref:Acyl-CoA N-acyltransferase n=1 Tax=Kockovaella imperatae TaxID=4999 RepID=A0A1Y1UB55_9TREE|nr:acyl-CoA N-acyltransferase [Kockovaella imperatae]ORX34315.1 acyl-CoA N-acyltransferase [Kockovaella imperatae]